MVREVWIFSTLAGLLGGQQICAQEKQVEEVITLQPITVTATPLEAEEQHIAQPVEVLRGEKLRRRQGLSIGETLAREPGISASEFGQGASRPIIRGLGGSRVRLLEGGIGSMDVSNLSPDHAVSIDPLQASQIEILKGPATLLYGSGAVGGIVNIVTDRISTRVPDAPSVDGFFRYGSATNERTGGGKVDAGLGNFALHFDGLKRRTSDYEFRASHSSIRGPTSNRESFLTVMSTRKTSQGAPPTSGIAVIWAFLWPSTRATMACLESARKRACASISINCVMTSPASLKTRCRARRA